MAVVKLDAFLADRNLLALKISSSDLPGLVRKTFRIPLNTTGLAHFADGSSALFSPGEELAGKFDLVLAKRGEIQLRLTFPDLRTADGFPIAVTCGLTVEISTTREDLFRDFCRVLFNLPGTYGTAELKSHLAPEVRRLLGGHAAGRPAAELHRADFHSPVAELLGTQLERFLFDAGVAYRKLVELQLVSSEYERRVSSQKREADEVRRSAQVIDRKEERLRRLAGILKDQDVQGLLTRVPDEKLKGLLYAKLMEDDAVQITAQELLTKATDCGEEVVGAIYKAMENLLSTGASVAPDEMETDRAERIFLATGAKVLEIDPAAVEPPRVHAFRDPLRSVRYLDGPGGGLLIGGGKRSISTVSLGDRPETLDYPLPEGRAVKGGVNSIASSGPSLFATHSEYGLAHWRSDRPGEPAEMLFEGLTRPHRTTRAVQVHGERLLFASGQHVYIAPVDAGEPPLKYVSSIESPVTCIASAAKTVFAGTESGAIVCWKVDAPDQPVVLVRQREAIVNLRLAKICAIPHLIYSTRDLSVRARVIGQNLETSYDSGGAQIGVLDAASDLIAASDAEGRRVLLWRATTPARPDRAIDVWKQSEKPVLDIWMKKVRAKSA
ncbi:MAG TPA: hypothetical protein VJB14_17685 [Planctomycetota bacterium]|nr:hypothetical protein [Planctomycetota bacterium]